MVTLKELMKKGVDVAELYTKVSDMSSVMDIIHEKEREAAGIEESIRDLLGDVPFGTLKIDLMNGVILILEEEYMYLESKND